MRQTSFRTDGIAGTGISTGINPRAGTGMGVKLPPRALAGTGMASHSLTGNSPLPSLLPCDNGLLSSQIAYILFFLFISVYETAVQDVLESMDVLFPPY
jgi:hypothetical protein